MNQGKLEVVNQEMARVNMHILRISKLKWMEWVNLFQLTIIYYCGQESLRRNGAALIVNNRVWKAVLGCSLKNGSMNSVHFQGKPFNIRVIQVYVPTSNAEEAVLWWPTRPFRTNTPKIFPFHYGRLECKSRKSRNTWSNRQIWPGKHSGILPNSLCWFLPFLYT